MEGRVLIICHVSDLKDNISMHWDSQAIADAVKPYIIQHRIDVVCRPSCLG